MSEEQTKDVGSMEEAVDQAANESNWPDDWTENMFEEKESSSPSSSEDNTKTEGSEDQAEKPSEEPKEKESSEQTSQKPAEEDESHLPEDLRTPKGASEDELKRIKGFQAAFTRKMQILSEHQKSLEDRIRSEYEQKFQSVVSRLAPGEQSAVEKQKTSLADFFPNADPNQLKPLEEAFSALIEQRVAPLKQENEALKQSFTARQQQETTQAQWGHVKSTYGVDDSILPDLVAWAEANPERAKGKSIEDVYLISTWERQRELGRKEALSELNKKQRESLETESAPNTVEDFEVKTLQDAMRMAEREINSKKE